jgi:DNA polymerase-3 subunit delta'
MTTTSPLWAGIVGQDDAIALLESSLAEPVHAYLFVGPAGTGKKRAARAFAAALLCREGFCGVCRDCTLALHGQHPDVTEVEREGAAISTQQADSIIHISALAPREGTRKVLLLDEFHLLSADAAAKLLKTIEEPTPGTFFVVLADQMTPDLVTIASRCIKVPFRSLSDEIVESTLLAEGAEPRMASEAARMAGGDLDRARLLATDPGIFARREAFASIVHRVDGTGARVMQLVDELLDLIKKAAEPLKTRQDDQAAALDAENKQFGERGSGKKKLEEQHKREQRRHRTDELRSGLATIAAAYRDRMAQGTDGRRTAEDAAAVERIMDAIRALDRNVDEELLLQSLLLTLPAI